MRTRNAALAALLLAGTALGGLAGWQAAPPAAAQAVQPAPQSTAPINVPSAPMPSFADMVARVRPAVVTITTTEQRQVGAGPEDMLRRYFGGPMQQERPQTVQALGSGFIVDAEGHIVTNNHVVDGATRVTVKLDDGRELNARIVGRDPRTDLALLKVDAGAPLPHLSLGDSDKVRVGDWVVAVGNPFGLGGTVTAGILSARGRDIQAGPYDDFLQVDAPINRGNSGGPLFSQDGNVIGVNTAIFSPTGGSIGIGFAIPSKLVQQVVSQLQANGHIERGWLGVSAQGVDTGIAAALRLPKPEGALVAETNPEGPAAKAGLRPGDVVTAVDGQAVTNPRDLARMIGEKQPNQATTLTIRRDGAEQKLQVTLGELQDRQQLASNEAQGERGGIGVALQGVTPELRRQLGLPAKAEGALVTAVRPGSPAEEAGLKPGDVIQGVGNQAVTGPEQASRALRESLRTGGPVALRVLRDGHHAFVAVQPAKPENAG
jgi:serine protease Do